MKLKLLIALVALVPSLVMAQAKPNPTPTVSSTGQSGGTGTANVGSVDLKGSYYYQPPTPTGGYIGQVGATQQQTATNPNSTTGSSASTNGSTYRGTSENQRESEPITVSYGGGKADGHGSSNKATVKGSSQGSTGTYPCYGAVICN